MKEYECSLNSKFVTLKVTLIKIKEKSLHECVYIIRLLIMKVKEC